MPFWGVVVVVVVVEVVVVVVHKGCSWSGPDPKGGGGTPPPSTMGFVGARGAGDFVLGIRQGNFFLFDQMCLYSKYSEFCGEFKNG